MSSSATSVPAEPAREKFSLLGRISTSPVYVFEKAIPDPCVLAAGLTLLSVLALALSIARNTAIGSIGVAWYNGVFNIFTFAFQMFLILVTDTVHPPCTRCSSDSQNAAISKAFISFSTANTLPSRLIPPLSWTLGRAWSLSCCPEPKLYELPWQERRWPLAIAGIGRRRMMGFMVIIFIVAFIAFGTSLLRLAQKG